MKRIYLYLANRSKKGIKILAVLKGENHPPMRISNLTQLRLPRDLEQKISQQIYADRMLWEPWIESATDYVELKTNLRNKGYVDVPMNSFPMFDLDLKSVVRNEQDHLEPIIKSIVKPTPTMLRKFSN